MNATRLSAFALIVALAGCGLSPGLMGGKASDQVTAKARTGKWWAVELHTHSSVKEGKNTISEIIRMAKEQGADALALSEHDTLAQFAEASFKQEQDLTLLHSTEWTSKQGHIGMHGPALLGWTATIPNTVTPAEAIARGYEGGATLIVHHPFAPGASHWTGGYDPRLNALEVWSGHYFVPDVDEEAQAQAFLTEDNQRSIGLAAEQGISWWDGLLKRGIRIPITAASDYHRWPQKVTEPCTLVYAPDKSENSLLKAIREGHTMGVRSPKSARLFLEADVAGDQSFTGVPGDSVKLTKPMALRVRADNADGDSVKLYTKAGLFATLKVKGKSWTQVIQVPQDAAYLWGRMDGSLAQFKL
ncbi:MAG TPA: CehA/McbA family metallohydrolase, partial [Stenomitos sp.]